MVDGVSEKVYERAVDHIDKISVDLGFASGGYKFDVFPASFSGIAYKARHFLEGALELDHTHRHAYILQFADHFNGLGDLFI